MIESVKLPSPVRARYAWSEIAKSARLQPGEWIPAGRVPASYVAHIPRGYLSAFPAGMFEATGRNNARDLGTSTLYCDLYVRLSVA